jgi:hypothetical protein
MTSTVLAAELKREISNRLYSELTIIKSFHKSEIKMKELMQVQVPFKIQPNNTV